MYIYRRKVFAESCVKRLGIDKVIVRITTGYTS